MSCTAELRKPRQRIARREKSSEVRAVNRKESYDSERFRNLVEVTSDWVWEVDRRGVYTYVSPKVRDILGYKAEEVLGKTPFDLMPPGEALRVGAIFNASIAKCRPFSCLENTNVHKDGHLVVLETSGVPFFDCKGTCLGYRGIDRDITERKRMEEKLKESAERARLHAKELEESYHALKVLLKQRENDKRDLEDNILSNVKHLILPYIEELKKSRQMTDERMYLNIIESNLNEIVSPFSAKLSFRHVCLTSKEIIIADLIKEGKQDKDIAEILSISVDTVKSHRKNIRKKLHLSGERTNLRTYLLSLVK